MNFAKIEQIKKLIRVIRPFLFFVKFTEKLPESGKKLDRFEVHEGHPKSANEYGYQKLHNLLFRVTCSVYLIEHAESIFIPM